MLSLGVMVYLIGRGSQKIVSQESSTDNFHIRFDKLVAKIPFEKMDIFISAQFEKFLRKIKLVLMKWDNLLANHLGKLKKTNEDLIEKEGKQIIFDSSENDQSKIKESR